MRRVTRWLGGLGVLALLVGAAQDRGETKVSPDVTGEERRLMPNLWVLDFAYKHPRMVTVEVPDQSGRPQRKLVWYLLYRVTNRTGEPRMFVPELTLVTDTGKVYTDEVMPAAQKAIIARENPLRSLENSATIGPLVPLTPEEGLEKSLYGVATWQGVDPATDRFSIFVTGLSNGYKVIDEGQDTQRVERKTLEIRYWRPGDEFFEHEKEIQFLDSQWLYR